MKKRFKIMTKGGLAVVLCLALFFLTISLALAQTDTDNDGIPDCVELGNCNGSTIVPMSAPNGYGFLTNPPYWSTGTASETSLYPCDPNTMNKDCVDYSTPDLFVMVGPYPTNVSASFPLPDTLDPLSDITQSANTSLWRIHYMSQPLDGTGRYVYEESSGQQAIAFTQSPLDLTSGTILGTTPVWGTPNTSGQCVIFTYRVEQWVEQACTAPGVTQVCYDTTSTKYPCFAVPAQNPLNDSGFLQNLQQLEVVYLQNLFAHEAGHSMELTATYDCTVGYHYPASTRPTIMDQYVYTTTKRGVLTWYIGDQYNKSDNPVLAGQ